jgi:hypothetical protein
MRRTIVLLATMALTLLVASGVALALTRIGTDGPNTLRGTKGDDNLIGKGGNDILLSLAGDDTLLGGPGKDVVTCGSGIDRVLADRADVVSPDCEKVFIGPAAADKFFNSIPESFFESLNPEVFG